MNAREDAHRAGSVRSRLLPALVALLCAIALAAPALASASQPKDIAGVALHPWRLDSRGLAAYVGLSDPATRERTFSMLAARGIRRARVDLKWSTLQPGTLGTGALLPKDWTEFDAIVNTAYKHGVQLEPMVAFPPQWANKSGHPWVYPTNPKDFEDFMAAVIARYPQIRVWEIWNEENWSRFAPPGPNPDYYTKLLRAAYNGRARAGSSAKLIVGGLSPAGETSMEAFAEQIARLGAFRYADALGVHPYSNRRPDEVGSSFLYLPELHRRVSKAAGRPVDIWLTEYGDPKVSEQAVRLQRGFALAVGWPWLKRLSWYGFRDDCSQPSNDDCNYGLVRENFSPKPAWNALGDVLAGKLPKLATSVKLKRKSRKVIRRGRKRRLQRLSGSVFMPGTDPAVGSVELTLRRRYRKRVRTRHITAALNQGRFSVEVGRLRRGRWRFSARFHGTRRYSPSDSRVLKLRLRK